MVNFGCSAADRRPEAITASKALAARQKAVQAKISQYKLSIEQGKRLSEGKFSDSELEKLAFLLRELKHEQAMIEEVSQTQPGRPVIAVSDLVPKAAETDVRS